MSYQNLSVSLTAAQKADIITKINALKTALPFLINLTTEEKKSLRKVAEKRQGYVNDVMLAVKANTNAIPSAVNTPEYLKDAQLYIDLSEIISQLKPIMEGLVDTYTAAGNEAITVTDQCYGFLKQAAKGNANLNDTVNKISKHFTGHPPKKVAAN